MNKIIWLKTTNKKYGGAKYGKQAQDLLAKSYNIEVLNLTKNKFDLKLFKFIYLIYNLLKVNKTKPKLFIRDDFLLNIIPIKGRNLIIIHHLDNSILPIIYKPIMYILESLFYYNVKKDHPILTVSEYWKNYFLSKGYKNVYKIYCGFDINEFNIKEKEVVQFKNKYFLKEKPIIYIGNCQKAKGVAETYEALKNINAYLVTSGERQVNIPSINLNLTYKEYLCLLKASDIVITMSKFKEGWCMTAHEAMLLKTPVIGSGKGGMEELLKGGGQIICKDFSILNKIVSNLLNNKEKRAKIGENGYNFAKKFTKDKFNKEWLALIKQLIYD